MIGAEQIKVNFETFNGVLEANFKDERLEKLKTLTDCLKERIMFAPASTKDWYNNSFPGGYLDNVLRVNKIANYMHFIMLMNLTQVKNLILYLYFVS